MYPYIHIGKYLLESYTLFINLGTCERKDQTIPPVKSMGDYFADSWFSYMGSAVTDRDRSGHCHGGCHFGTSPVLLCNRTLDGSCRYRRAAGSYSIFCYTECSGCPFHAWSCICRNRTCNPVRRSREACYDRHFQAVQGIHQWN